MTTTRDDTSHFPSLAALRAAHLALLGRHRAEGNTPELLEEASDFIGRGVATGAFIDDDDERWSAQGLLDYWSTVLVRAGHEPGDASLAEFEAALAPELPEELRPYIGLDAFREGDRALFFGRQRLIGDLVEHLKTNRLLALVGPSGSGKSSLVRAGLVPALQAGALELGAAEVKDVMLRRIFDKLIDDAESPQFTSSKWRYIAPFMPGSDPLANLANAIEGELPAGSDATQFVKQLQQHEGALLAALGGEDAVPVVLVVDQFEELFTLCDYPHIRTAFIDNLLRLVQSPIGRHTVILTMRSDFEPFVARVPSLLPVFERARVQVPPMSASELREAIEKPAEQVGLRFESGVVDALLQDILGEPAALPLLQFTLLKLWEARDHNRVTWDAYQRVGGGRLALARSADQFYDQLIPEEQITARRILLRMVRPGEGLEMTSNRVRHEMLYRAGEAPDRVDRVLSKLVAARLVRVTVGETDADQQLEVAHEALVRNWPRLAQWLEDEKAAIATRRRLEGRAAEWVRLGQREGGLLDEVELRDAEHWLHSPEAAYLGYDPILDTLVQASQGFLRRVEQERLALHTRELTQAQALAEAKQRELEQARALAAEQQHRVEEQQRRAEEQEAANERLLLAQRRIGRALALACVLALVAVLFGIQSWRNAADANRSAADANRSAADAQAQQQTAVSAQQAALAQQQTAVAAGALAEQQRATAVAANIQTQYQQATAVAAQQMAVAEGERVKAEALRARAGQLAAEAQAALERQPQRALLLAVEAVRLTQAQNMPPAPVALDTLRTIVGATSGRGLSGHTAAVLAVAVSPDGRRLATGGEDQTIRLWDLTSAAAPLVLDAQAGAVRRLAISPDGHWLASASADQTVHLWDLRAADIAANARVLRGHTAAINALAISPDGRWLATASADQTARLWDLNAADPAQTGRVLGGSNTHTGPVTCLTFSPNGRLLITGSTDRTAHLWDMTGSQPGRSRGLFRNRGLIFAVAVNPDSNLLVMGGAEDTRAGQARVEVWTLSNSGNDRFVGLLSSNQGAVTAVAFSPDKRWLVTASTDRTAKLWDTATISTATPQSFVLGGHEGVITSVAISPDSRWLATTSADRTARLWNLTARDPAASVRILRGHDGPINAAVISADARLATGSADNAVRVWALPLADRVSQANKSSTDELITLACSTAGRNLTPQEWDESMDGAAYRATCAP